MKKAYLITLLTLFLILGCAKSQICSYQLVGYNGIGTIYYPYSYYQGGVINGCANGTGTMYWSDGSFFNGNFVNGLYQGPGVLVSRYYGYVTGCWNYGMYVGTCQDYNNPYNNDQYVENVVTRVQNNMPQDSPDRFQNYDPDGYKITKIDPNTEIGKTVLGRYK